MLPVKGDLRRRDERARHKERTETRKPTGFFISRASTTFCKVGPGIGEFPVTTVMNIVSDNVKGR